MRFIETWMPNLPSLRLTGFTLDSSNATLLPSSVTALKLDSVKYEGEKVFDTLAKSLPNLKKLIFVRGNLNEEDIIRVLATHFKGLEGLKFRLVERAGDKRRPSVNGIDFNPAFSTLKNFHVTYASRSKGFTPFALEVLKAAKDSLQTLYLSTYHMQMKKALLNNFAFDLWPTTLTCLTLSSFSLPQGFALPASLKELRLQDIASNLTNLDVSRCIALETILVKTYKSDPVTLPPLPNPSALKVCYQFYYNDEHTLDKISLMLKKE